MDDTEKSRKREFVNKITFTKKQNIIITRAISMLSLCLVFGLVSLIVFYVFKFINVHSNVLLPPIVALIISEVIKPVYDRLRLFFWSIFGGEKLGRRVAVAEGEKREALERRTISLRSTANYTAIVVLLVAIIVPLGMFLFFFGSLLADQLVALFNALPGLAKWIYEAGTTRLPRVMEFADAHDLMPLIQQLNPQNWFDVSKIGKVTSSLGSSAFTVWDYLKGIVVAGVAWFVLPVYMVIYLASRPLEGADFTKYMIGASERTRKNVRFLIDEFIRIVVAFFRGQVLVAFILGIMFGFGFQFIAGISYGMILGITLGIINIVPYLGNITGMPVICALALFGGKGVGWSFMSLTGLEGTTLGWVRLMVVFLIFTAVQMLDAYFITPKIVGKRTGLNAFAVIFSLFFWASVIGGALGMVLAIPLSAFIVVMVRFLALEYFGETVDAAVDK
ncbi:MAG: AI-2E family transporter [Lentisphaerae bacterium]|jgi:predicted PurR-regulated permease PerM|nr:AI-2E family transporter [Lentisphaerota bacterium]